MNYFMKKLICKRDSIKIRTVVIYVSLKISLVTLWKDCDFYCLALS